MIEFLKTLYLNLKNSKKNIDSKETNNTEKKELFTYKFILYSLIAMSAIIFSIIIFKIILPEIPKFFNIVTKTFNNSKGVFNQINK